MCWIVRIVIWFSLSGITKAHLACEHGDASAAPGGRCGGRRGSGDLEHRVHLDREAHRQGRDADGEARMPPCVAQHLRSEEHTSELQSLMRSSYAVFCLKKNKN